MHTITHPPLTPPTNTTNLRQLTCINFTVRSTVSWLTLACEVGTESSTLGIVFTRVTQTWISYCWKIKSNYYQFNKVSKKTNICYVKILHHQVHWIKTGVLNHNWTKQDTKTVALVDSNNSSIQLLLYNVITTPANCNTYLVRQLPVNCSFLNLMS